MLIGMWNLVNSSPSQESLYESPGTRDREASRIYEVVKNSPEIYVGAPGDLLGSSWGFVRDSPEICHETYDDCKRSYRRFYHNSHPLVKSHYKVPLEVPGE